MIGILTSSVSQLFTFIKTSTLAKIILIIILLIVFLMVVIPLISKAKRKTLKEKETKDIMKDLLTWRHLAQLVKGGDEHSKAKHELSDNIVRINELLKSGFTDYARRNKSFYSVPWFALLGEPRSGKSALLEASDLELKTCSEEKNAAGDGKNSLPVRLWSGAKAVVYDISGNVFFDRWLEGSSAEWNHIVKQICKRRSKKPLDGIILTIPADALLADDETLASRKAILMASELGNLLRTSGMHLPCYVVVTKLDMVSGFTDWVRKISGDLRHQIVGFENGSAVFEAEKFNQFKKDICERIREGSKSILSFASAAVKDGENRMDTAGKLWLFPENFSCLFDNLKIYLNVLFGEENFHGTKNTFFEGVYFASATDIGFSLSPPLASLVNSPVDSVLIPNTNYNSGWTPLNEDATSAPDAAKTPLSLPAALKPALNANTTALIAVPTKQTALVPSAKRSGFSRGYFIRDMLHKRIFTESPHTGFVSSELFRRHTPHYLVCALMLLLGIFFLFAVVFDRDDLRVSLIQVTAYYDWLDSVLQKQAPFKSFLIKEDSSGKYLLDNDPVAGESLSSRVQFYFNAVSYRDMKVPVPAGFGLSDTIVSGFDPSLGYRDKAFISNQLHSTMVRMPVIRNTGNKLIEDQDQAVLTADLKGVINSFTMLDEVKETDFHNLFAKRKFNLLPMIKYLMPEISSDTQNLLNSFIPSYDRPYSFNMDIKYIYSDEFHKADVAALNTIISSWRRGDVYPESIYGRIRSLVNISEQIVQNYSGMNDALRRINGVVTLEQVQSAVNQWMSLLTTYNSLTNSGRAIFTQIEQQMLANHIPLGFKQNTHQIKTSAKGITVTSKPVDAFGDNLINDYLFNDIVINLAVKEWKNLFDADMEFVKNKSAGDKENLGMMISLQNVFAVNLNREVENLRERAGKLKNNPLLADKVVEKADADSLFTVVEKILSFSGQIVLPNSSVLQKAAFGANWQQGQSNIKLAFDEFDAYTKPYLENDKVAVLISNARNMLLAEAYLNRWTIFTTSLAFLSTSEGNIAATINERSGKDSVFSFSGDSMQVNLAITNYSRSYDPLVVDPIIGDVSSFAALFIPTGDKTTLPLFLQNVDKGIYQPPAFMNYLRTYIAYWSKYPDRVYNPASDWIEYKKRVTQYQPFQINSVLMLVYSKSIDIVNRIPDTILNDTLQIAKKDGIAALNSKSGLLTAFLSTDADKMLSSWSKLPIDPDAAYTILQTASAEALKESYLSVYSPKEEISIGFWNDFSLNGITVLVDHFSETSEAKLLEIKDDYLFFPICSDLQTGKTLTVEQINYIAGLLKPMGAGLTAQSEDPVEAALHPKLFNDTTSAAWAAAIYNFASHVADKQKPLTWTITQPPIDIQNKLPSNGKI
ncbi:hypothetical protein FACS189494_01060 [Spirochaetia bacterium]|nr:hypothetical protein FACS189494_01060 [Spirochaetia bacterium]